MKNYLKYSKIHILRGIKTYQGHFNKQTWGSSKNDDISLFHNGKTFFNDFEISVIIDS